MMGHSIIFYILLSLVASSAAAALVPRFVVISNDVALSNQTRATIDHVKSLAYQEFQISSSTFDTAITVELRVSSVSSSAVSQVVAFASTTPNPCFYFIQVNQPAIAAELSRLQLPFVDFFAMDRAVEAPELRVTFQPNLRLEAAATLLQSFNWNQTILFWNPQRRNDAQIFQEIASQKGIFVDIKHEISALFASELPQTLSSTLASTSNVVTLLADPAELKAIADIAQNIYDFQIVWVPTREVDSDDVQTNVLNRQSFRGIFTVQQDNQFAPSYNLIRAASGNRFGISNFKFTPTVAPADVGFCSFPSTFHPSLPFVADATRAFIYAMNRASNASDLTSIITALRSIEELSGGVTGPLHLNSDRERVGDMLILNHIFNISSVLVAAEYHGPVNSSTVSDLEFLVPVSAMRFALGGNVLPPSTHKPIFLVGLIWDTLYDDTYSWLVAARLAVNLINERNTMPGWDFRAVFYNDELTAAGTILGAVALTAQNVRAVVAGTTSSQATAGMYYLAAQNIPMISGAATSDTLSNKLNFPTFMRTVAPDRFQGKVLADLVKFFQWDKICTLNDNNDYASNVMARLIGELSTSNVTIVRSTFAASDTDLSQPFKILADARCRIIIAAIPVQDGFSIAWNEAKKQNLLGPGIQWIMSDSAFSEFSPGLSYLRERHSLDPELLKGVLVVAPLSSSASSEYPRFVSDFQQVAGFAPFDAYVSYWYDAVWTTAIAAKNLLLSPGGGADQLFNRTAYFDSLLATRFQGLTGSISFNADGDREDMPFGIYNFVPVTGGNHMRNVGRWAGSLTLNVSSITFADGTSNIPVDELPLPTTDFLFSWGGPAAIAAVAALVLAFVVVTTIGVIILKDNKLIFRSSPLFLIIIAFGITLALVSVFFWFGEASVAKCHLRLWFGFIGFALAYGAMLAKNARLWYLFSEPSLRVIAITNQQLVSYLMMLVAPQIIVLVLWSSLETHTIGTALNGSRTMQYLVCSSQNSRIFAPISFSYMLLLLVIGGVLSFKTRVLPDIFRESNWIALSTYNYIFTATVCLVISFSITSEPIVAVVIACVGIVFSAFMNWALIFLPKFWIIFVRPELVEEWSSGRTPKDSKGSGPNEYMTTRRTSTAAATYASSGSRGGASNKSRIDTTTKEDEDTSESESSSSAASSSSSSEEESS